jgi:archaellum component FlaC
MLGSKKAKKDITNRELLHVIDKRFDGVDKRFEQIDKRFDGVDKRFEQIDKRFDGVDKRFELLDNKIDKEVENLAGMVSRRFDNTDKKIEKIENIMTMDHKRRIERLEFDVKILKDALAI